jgi:hypothetical protein
MKKLVVTFALCILLAGETQAAEVGTFCQEENGRFTYNDATVGKVTGLTQAGLDSLRKKAGQPLTSAKEVEECKAPKVSAVSAIKDWFTQFTKELSETVDDGDILAKRPSADDGRTIHQGTNNEGFDAILIMTQDAESVLRVGTGAQFTMFSDLVSINLGEPIEALLLFRGCSVNSNGDCLVTADYVIEAPDGSTYQEALNTDVWKESGSAFAQYHLTNTRIGFLLQPDADVGIYKVRVTVSDMVNETQISLLGNVEVSAIIPKENDKVQPSLGSASSNPWHEPSSSEGISVRTK